MTAADDGRHRAVANAVWRTMTSFVSANDRRRQLQDALGLGRGMGRVKLLVVLGDGPVSLRDLAEALGSDAPYATVIVDQLARAGMVARTAHPDDRRRRLVVLTPAGEAAVAKAQAILADPPEALAALSPADLAVLEALMAKIRQPPSQSDT